MDENQVRRWFDEYLDVSRRAVGSGPLPLQIISARCSSAATDALLPATSCSWLAPVDVFVARIRHAPR